MLKPGFAFIGKAGLGPFWTLVRVLLYSDVVHAPRQLLRLLLPAQAYGYRREDLCEDAMQDLIDNLI
jgi:hypothetical protein